MAPYSLFRIGALILVLTGLLHLAGHFTPSDPTNGSEFTLRDLMYNYRTNLMGVMRSKGELFDGLSLAFSVMNIGFGALGFTIPATRKPAIVFAITLALITVIGAVYWFVLPVTMVGAAMLCFGLSALLNR
jgi:hypothetical protein